jgi:hypothetical protein
LIVFYEPFLLVDVKSHRKGTMNENRVMEVVRKGGKKGTGHH